MLLALLVLLVALGGYLEARNGPTAVLVRVLTLAVFAGFVYWVDRKAQAADRAARAVSPPPERAAETAGR